MDNKKLGQILAQIIVCTIITCVLAAVVCVTAKLLSLLFI